MFDAYLYVSVRALHVLLATFWAGAILFIMIFLDPATREAGPAGGQVMGILQRRGWVTAALVVGLITLLTGFYLLWVVSGHFRPDFMGSRRGILLSVGMLAGVLTLAIGFFGSRPTARRISEVAARMAPGSPPAPQDAAEMARLRGRLKMFLRAAGTLLLLAVLTMAWGSHG